MQAIWSATMDGAALLGMSKQIGSIEVGKLADVIGVRGNPLADVRRIEDVMFVIKNGQRIDFE